MNNAVIYTLFVLGAYLIGAIPFGLLIGKCYGIDIRKMGSCNIGATNVTRSVGKTAGKVCFFLDMIKGAIPAAVTQWCCPEVPLLALCCGAAAILGHIFPIYLKFKGGKGVSTGAGVVLALAPLPLLCAFVVWVTTFFISRYVSLASIVAAVALPIFAVVFKLLGIGTPTAKSLLTLGFFIAAALLTLVRHRENIKRLLAGTESRFEKK